VREPGDRRLRVHWQERHSDLPLTLLDADPDGVAATLPPPRPPGCGPRTGTLLTVVVAEQVVPAAGDTCSPPPGGAFSILWALRQESGVAVTDLNYHPVGHRRQIRPGSDSLATLVSKRLVRHGRHQPGLRRGGGPIRHVEAIVLVSEGDRPHPAGTALRLHHLPRRSAGPARGDRTGTAGPGRSRLGPARGEDPLEVVPSPYRDLTATVLNFVDRAARRAGDGTMLNVIIPEFRGHLDHRQAAPQPVRLWIRGALYADTGSPSPPSPGCSEHLRRRHDQAPPRRR